MDYRRITEEELEENDDADLFYICNDCLDRHLVKFEDIETMILGYYTCRGRNHLYSINGKQVD